MKKITLVLLSCLSLSVMAQSNKDKDIVLIKDAIKSEYKNPNFSTLEKWIIYDIEEENTKTHQTHKPAMVFLVAGVYVVEHYYMAYDPDLGVYAYSFCNCCHLEKGTAGLVAHCEETCTMPPFTLKMQLEHLKSEMKNLVIYK